MIFCLKQECISVGCIPSAAMAFGGGVVGRVCPGGGCLPGGDVGLGGVCSGGDVCPDGVCLGGGRGWQDSLNIGCRPLES